MPLYCVQIDDLIKEVKGQQLSCVMLAGINIVVPVFADDLTLIALCRLTLTNLVGTANRYSKRWNFEYNLLKSLFLAWGRNKKPLRMGNGEMQAVTQSTHVGVPLCTTKKAELEAVTSRINETRRLSLFLNSLGSMRKQGVNPVTTSKLYHAVCIPKLLYGLEVWDLSPECLNKLESFHEEVGRRIQWLPDNTSSPACHATLGWFSVEGLIDIMRLMFLWKLVMLSCRLAQSATN